MERLLLSEIAGYAGGTLIGPDCEIDFVSTDTRTISAGSLFIPIKGKNFDGHRFIDEACERGALAFFSEIRDIKTEKPFIHVADTSDAFLLFAEHYKERYEVLTVGITGSVGKTTTKEMTASILSEKYKTLKSEGNLNNFVGLPLCILNLDKSFDAAVLEMGMSAFGEIDRLSKTAKPDAAVITAIGVSHIEYLGSREGILKAKLEIINGLKEDGVAVLNGDEPLLYNLKGSLPVKTVYFGRKNPECDILAENIFESDEGLSFTLRTNDDVFDIWLNAAGRHNVSDALAAAGCALHFGLSPDAVRKGLKKFKNVGMRQNIYVKNGIRVIEDCYNASPDSVLAALSVLKNIKADGRRFAVLGGMGELGGYAKKGHIDCGKKAALSCRFLYAYGANAEYYLEGAKEAGMEKEALRLFSDKSELAKELYENLQPGDALLVKGSRSMKMEDVLKLLFGEYNNEV